MEVKGTADTSQTQYWKPLQQVKGPGPRLLAARALDDAERPLANHSTQVASPHVTE